MEVKADELLYKLQNYITNVKRGSINGKAAVEALLNGKNIFVIYGEEPYYRMQIIKYLQEYILLDIEEQDREITIYEKDTNSREVEATINSYPFFSGKSYVVLQDEKLLKVPPQTEGEAAKERRKKTLEGLASIVSDVPEYCAFLITSTGIDKRTKLFKAIQKQDNALLCECKGIELRNIGEWVQKQAAKHGATLDYEAMATIMEYLSPIDKEAPLQLLQNEFDKLAIYKAGESRWTREDIEAIFSALPEAGSFALRNAFGNGKLQECLTLLAGERKRKTNILPITASLQSQLRRMLQIKELLRQGYNAAAIADALKLNAYVVKITAAQLRRFEEAELRKALLDMNQLNMDLRKGGRGYERLEEILVELLGKRA